MQQTPRQIPWMWEPTWQYTRFWFRFFLLVLSKRLETTDLNTGNMIKFTVFNRLLHPEVEQLSPPIHQLALPPHRCDFPAFITSRPAAWIILSRSRSVRIMQNVSRRAGCKKCKTKFVRVPEKRNKPRMERSSILHAFLKVSTFAWKEQWAEK